ncbi:tRNA lysidine(34) synthetase TilS [Thalassobacillus hwangdonensis]
MKATVDSFIESQQFLQENCTVLVAVSGGADSMALLHYLKELKKEKNLTLIALSVDHGLRGNESLEDLQFVQSTCQEWGIEFSGTSVDVTSYKKKHGCGTQQAARSLRYDFFEQQMSLYEADVLALAHHGDDQAETLIMRLMRVTNPAAFQGIPLERVFGKGRIIRPLLCVEKQAILEYCKINQVPFRDDPSNADPVYTRNYIRLNILPLFKEQNPKFHRHAQLLSQRATEDEAFLHTQANSMVENVVKKGIGGREVSFEINEFSGYPIALQRRAFHLILNYLYRKAPNDLSYIHEEQFFDILNREMANARLDFPEGLRLYRSYGTVTFRFGQAGEPYTFELSPGESITLPDGGEISLSTSSDNQKSESAHAFACDIAHVSLPLIIRTRQPGDRMSCKGMEGSKKIKDIFIDQKVPADKRDTWPIVTDHTGRILWLVGLKKSEGKPSEVGTGEWLHVHYKNNETL